MKKFFSLFLIVISLISFVRAEEDYVNEDYMVDPKINSPAPAKVKKQLGEASYETIQVDQVIAGDRYEDNSHTADSDSSSGTSGASSGEK